MLDPLITIVYVSSATTLMAEPALQELLQQARERNAREGITGLLLYCEGNFMQCFEGPRKPMLEVYASIRRDPRHTGLLELTQHEIKEREFAQWSMAFSHAHQRQMDALLKADSEAQAQTSGSSAVQLLAAFWREQMGLQRYGLGHDAPKKPS